MGFIRSHKKIKIWFIVTSIVLVLAIIINTVLLKVPLVTNSLSLVFGGERASISEDNREEQYDRQYANKEEVLNAANDFVVEVEKEGIVLLKNENDVLPLSMEDVCVSVLGKNSSNLVYSGSGSGASSGSDGQKTIYESLEAAGISYNETLKSFYEDSTKSGDGRPENPAMTSGQRLAGFETGETPMESYTSEVKDSFADYQDAAIVILSRIGGEGFDLPRTMADGFGGTAVNGAVSADSHYLELDTNEKELLTYAKENFSQVIVLLNVGTSMEVPELQADDEIDAILWMGFPGATGIMALGQILTGVDSDGNQISPSGHTVDTWASDFTQDPTWYNSGVYGSEYGNRYLYNDEKTDYAFVNYEEGIYVGYRYYETRGYEEIQADPQSTWYEDSVVYPFGYGLSYTTFEWDVSFTKTDESQITAEETLEVSVTVKNVGDHTGKDVVQLYYSAPYDYNGPAIEKAHVVLGDFAKTELLAPGEEEKLTLTLDVKDMKSYDYADANENGFKGYELESGKYNIMVGSDAHTVQANAGYTLNEGVQIATEENADGEEVEVVNAFDDVSAGIFGTDTYASYTSRKDFAGTVPTTYLEDSERTLTDELKAELDESIKRKYTDSDEGQPWEVTGDAPLSTPVNNGLSLQDMLDDEDGNYVGEVSYDDPRWETLLDEISLDEMKNLVGFGAFRTNEVQGIDGVVAKPLTTDADGPNGFTSFVSESVIYGTCAYQAECVMGSTWNLDLAEKMGELVGEEGLAGNEKGDGLPYSGWYAPAVNIHRSPFAGRNWEYYSEDGLLSGKFAASVVRGADKKGVYCYLKHFAVNDQETDREYNGILVWSNEQAVREIYLLPFEMAVKEGGATGMMTSFNRLGMKWAGGSYALLTQVLRDEWGFHGTVITDYSLNTYTRVDEMIRAGGDLFLTQDAKTFSMPDDATQITLLRQATKNILYSVVNSNAMSIKTDGYLMPTWMMVMIVVDCVILIALILWGVFAFRSTKKKE
ncbi:MAG: glycoside hydrolase family 3 C-terminal domain-containing protein [Suipraeoptans sp.]